MSLSVALLLDVATGLCLLTGCGFVLIGTLGLLRLPDFYTRLHAAGVIDTLGAWLILLGMALQSPNLLTGLKLLMLFALLLFASPTTSHLLARAALHAGLKPQLAAQKSQSDE